MIRLDDTGWNPTEAHVRSQTFIIDPAYSAAYSTPVPEVQVPFIASVWIYGEAELECYRLAVLRKRAKEAKLKVWYPGTFYSPSPSALFRVKVCTQFTNGTGEINGFWMQSNANIISVTMNEDVIYQTNDASSTDHRHQVLFSARPLKGHLRIDLIMKEKDEEEIEEPPCLHIEGDRGSIFQEESWEWSTNGSNWSSTRGFPSVDGAPYPHLAEARKLLVAPEKCIENNIYDFGRELLGRIVLQGGNIPRPLLQVGESLEEALNDDNEHQEQSTEVISVACDGEEPMWRSLHPLAFRYVRVESASVEIEQVFCQAQFHPVQYHGAFAVSDEVLSRTWMSAAYTLCLCMHDFLVDGIKRDRLPWTGDLAVSLIANAYVFADAEIVRRSLTALGRAGIAEQDINGIVDYSLWWIICQDLYQLYFDDKAHLLREWRRIKEALFCLIERCSDDGFLVTKDEEWVFIDWVDMNKTSALQILWWWALNCGASLGQRVNDDQTAVRLQSLQVSLKARLLKSYWNNSKGLWLSDPDVPNEYSRHANLLAVVSGLTTQSTSIKDALEGDVLPSVGTPYMKFFECLALSRLGQKGIAMNKVRSYWGGMLRSGASTFFEAFAEGQDEKVIAEFYNRPYGKSLCHAWSAGPCNILPETVLGIRPLADGWKKWTCSAQLLDGCGDWACATVPTPHGCLEVNATPTNLRIVVPCGTTLELDSVSYAGPRTVELPTAVSDEEEIIDGDTIKKWSAPYRGWHYYPDHVIPPKPDIPGFESVTMTDVPTIYQLPEDSKTWYMSFIGFDYRGYQSFVAESVDLLRWTNLRLAIGFGKEGEFDFGGRVIGAYLYTNYNIKQPRILKKRSGQYWSLYGAYAKQGGYEIDPGYEGIAKSEDGFDWHRAKDQCVLSVHDPDVGDWEKSSIYQPWLVEHNGQFYNFYNAKKETEWIEQIGIANSSNLLEWRRSTLNPVLTVRPEGFDATFCSDGKVFRDGDHWVMFYFGVNKDGAHIMLAFSRDLYHWTADPEPLYKAGGNPSGLDKQYAHKISLVWNPTNETWYMFYCAVGNKGRGIGLITSRPIGP